MSNIESTYGIFDDSINSIRDLLKNCNLSNINSDVQMDETNMNDEYPSENESVSNFLVSSSEHIRDNYSSDGSEVNDSICRSVEERYQNEMNNYQSVTADDVDLCEKNKSCLQSEDKHTLGY